MATSTLDQFVNPIEPSPVSTVVSLRAGARAQGVLVCAALVALLAYGVWTALHFSSGFGGADTAGYINSARVLTEGKLTRSIHLVPELGTESGRYCVPLGFTQMENSDIMAPAYPVGLPALLALFGMIAGWHWGPLLLYVGGVMLTLFFCYASSRELGVAPIWAILGAAMFACSPLLIWSAEHLMSDGVAATWNAAAFYAALRSRRSYNAAACCGAAFMLAVTIRPTNIFILPALIVVTCDWKKLAAGCLGGLPLAILLAGYNKILWGEPWKTGYDGFHKMFEWASLGPTLVFYAKWIPDLLPIGALGLICLPFLAWRSDRRELLGLLLWSFALLGFYAFYPLTRLDWWWLRYVLPAFPALVILGTLGIDRLASFTDRNGRPLIAGSLSAALVLVSFGLSVRDWEVLHVPGAARSCDAYMTVADWVKKNTPENAIISTLHLGGTLLFDDERIVIRWDQIRPAEWTTVVASARQSGRPLYFFEWPDFVDEAIKLKTPGAWKKITDIDRMRVWQLSMD
jgi:hypothetical protein